MDQIINNEISNSKSVQILRAEQTLESSMQRGGVKMTKQFLNGENNLKGGQTMEQMLQGLNLPEFKEVMAKYITDPVFKDLPFADKKAMAEVEFNAMIEVAKATIAAMTTGTGTIEKETEEKAPEAVEQKEQPSKKEDGMDQFMDECYQLVTSRAVITAKVVASLIYKYVDKYGDSVDNVARYMAAFFDYYTTEGGEKHVKRLGWDVILILGAQLGKNLAGDWEVIADIIEGGETVLKYKTGADLLRAGWGGVKYAKKNKETAVKQLLDFGSKQKLTSMAFSAIDELLDQE